MKIYNIIISKRITKSFWLKSYNVIAKNKKEAEIKVIKKHPRYNKETWFVTSEKLIDSVIL